MQGLSRSDATARAALISRTYRDGGNSRAIATEADALAYALARMPATYAAVTASLNALREVHTDFAPDSLLDVGAGPGTATWAAAEAFSSLGILRCSTPTAPCARWRWISPAAACGCAISNISTATPAPRWRMRRRLTSWWRAM
jgi:Mitochondrial small ribosomal subunit Rsm22